MIEPNYNVRQAISILISTLLIFGFGLPFVFTGNSNLVVYVSGEHNKTHLELILSYYETLVENDFTEVKSKNPSDTSRYYGLAGGVAGVGMELLRTLNSTNFGGFSAEIYKNRILTLVKSLEKKLLQFAAGNNDTHAYWWVSNNIQKIDLGYDFGLSGILSFYSLLAKETNNSTYTVTATKILNTISSLGTTATTARWKTNLASIISGVFWYTLDGVIPHYTFVRDLERGETILPGNTTNFAREVTFLGKSFGATGLGLAALAYYDAPNSNKVLAKEIINKVNSFLFSFTENLSNWKLPVAKEFPTVISNSLSTGLSGFGQYFLQQALKFNNETIEMVSKDIVDLFFIGQNYNVTFYEGSIKNQDVYGLEVGLTGNLAFLSKAKKHGLLNTSQEVELMGFANSLSSLSIYLSLTQIDFPERGYDTSRSFSSFYGTTGILMTLIDFDDTLNSTKHLDRVDLFRETLYNNYLVYIGEVPYLTDISGVTNGGGLAVGAVGLIKLLLLPSPPAFSSLTGALDFGNVKVGESKVLNFSLTNIGERDGSLNLSKIPEGFEASTASTIKTGSTVELLVTFTPTQQKLYNESIIVSLNDAFTFTLTVSGTSFSGPSITLNSPDNGSTITNSQELSFTLESEIGVKSTTVTISNSSNSELVNSALTFRSGNIYTYTWDITNFQSGNYMVVIEAEDLNSYISSETFQFSIEREVTDVIDPFSGVILYVLIGFGILVIILAIVLIKQFL